MSLPAMSFGNKFCFSRKGGIGGGGWVHMKDADSMAVSGLSFGNALVGSGRVGHCCPPMHEWVEKTVFSPCMTPISSGEAFFSVRLSCNYCKLVNWWVWLSHERVEGGCKSTCAWNLGAEPDRIRSLNSLSSNKCTFLIWPFQAIITLAPLTVLFSKLKEGSRISKNFDDFCAAWLLAMCKISSHTDRTTWM